VSHQTNVQFNRAQLVELLNLSGADKDWFTKILELFKPNHGIRSIALDDIRSGFQDLKPELLDQYDSFRALLPTVAPFSFVPVEMMALLTARAGTLARPGLGLREAASRWSRLGSKRFFKNPLFLMSRQAADNKFEDFLEMSANNQVFNFGQTKLYRVGPRHYEQVCIEQYSEWGEVTTMPFFESLLEEFQLKGKVEFEARGPYEFQIDIQWDAA
jgi:hypothetical protein